MYQHHRYRSNAPELLELNNQDEANGDMMMHNGNQQQNNGSNNRRQSGTINPTASMVQNNDI